MGPTSTIYKSFTTQNLKFKLQKEIIKTVYVTIYKSIKKKKKQNKTKKKTYDFYHELHVSMTNKYISKSRFSGKQVFQNNPIHPGQVQTPM